MNLVALEKPLPRLTLGFAVAGGALLYATLMPLIGGRM